MTFDSLSCSIPAAPQLDFDKNKLRMLIADYVGIKPEKVTDETHFTDDLGLDWLDQVELMIRLKINSTPWNFRTLMYRSKSSAISSGTSNENYVANTRARPK